MKNIKITVAYDGTDFCGWQRQPNVRTVAGDIEAALAALHGVPTNLIGSGRTDAGVHAASQCANFFTNLCGIPPNNFVPILNKMLPCDVRITSAVEVDESFNARFDALMRSYRYYFVCSNKSVQHMMPFENRYALHLRRYPNIKLLNDYARLLHGELDCSLFASPKDLIFTRGSGSKCRFIYNAYFFYEGKKLVFEISANAFFWRMVRSIAGTLLFYESRATPLQEFAAVLKEGNRKKAGTTLVPNGLFLWQVVY
ncbi:MAG: tRNA pseudouridine(38-40) synthase TruA [Termitinemataceae bacterium]|nr:MAG: tRNA pseudouridine(38-40) synthase TruA [Termitinemataceae bacterium]